MDYDSLDELWLTTIAGHAKPPTMAALIASHQLAGTLDSEINNSFYQIAVSPLTVANLIDKIMEITTLSHTPILPMEVEEGAILVQQEGTAWAMAISRQHRLRLRRDHDLRLQNFLTSVYVHAPTTM